ncbi:MAG: OmpA family protein [Proteobacteria bacterium]|nr:OmpA family protein [Pseudomonadota bacterium]
MKPMTKFMIAAFAATTLSPAFVMAQTQDSKNQGYLLDTSGNIVRSGTGLCWHTSDWTPARAVESCDPVNKPVAVVIPAQKPVQVAEATPAPAKVAVAQSQSRKISFSGDALFAFDKSVLKPEGKTMLDDMVRQLDGATYDTILATGHTDRFGSNQYNQKLSERRAHTVKDYLVSKNVQASRIDAEGKGETEPMTKAGECKGKKSAKVVACLQPDRRVDVEVKGTKTVVGSL